MRAWLLIAVVILIAAPCNAGMPSPLPTDVARELRLTESPKKRIASIATFAVVIVASAFTVQWLWNGIRKDFQSLPKINYGRSLMIVIAWGAMFVIVLTMISGARELMTPGAWEQNGLTYELIPPAEKTTGAPGVTTEEK